MLLNLKITARIFFHRSVIDTDYLFNGSLIETDLWLKSIFETDLWFTVLDCSINVWKF